MPFWSGTGDACSSLYQGCPKDLYGENCDTSCPPCYNGGICHDKWGVCVCPAGFTGPNCEIACGGNHFGADCSKFCSRPQNNSNTDELCALHLFANQIRTVAHVLHDLKDPNAWNTVNPDGMVQTVNSLVTVPLV
ncbi:tyrosine-protein kinase receptor Tie-1 [Trichonephila clavipes]|nr:tyrosine-protein kinase receptor Tie-1 [Trichonephila clavipes]